MGRKHTKTALIIIDKELWEWAKYRTAVLGFKSISEYIFDLIKLDKETEAKEERVKGAIQRIFEILDEMKATIERLKKLSCLPPYYQNRERP